MKFTNKKLERKLFRKGYSRVIGVDEVGMGCLAGPVVVCAVSFTPEFYRRENKKLFNVRDSKALSPSQREYLSDVLRTERGLRYTIGLCHPKTIDRVNIYQASRLAMKRAVDRLMNKELRIKNRGNRNPNSSFPIPYSRCMVLVDGPRSIAGLNVQQKAIVKGDRKVFAIACASILAKTYRDRMMVRYAKKYPKYCLDIHKGYGTKLHRARLLKHGPCPLHRQSFRIA